MNLFLGNMAQLCVLPGILVLSSLLGQDIGNIWAEAEGVELRDTSADNFVSPDGRPVLCGRRPAVGIPVQPRDVDDGLDKIIGGRTTAHGKFPWTVNIYGKTMKNGVLTSSQMCGGAIISEYWVLTAASCLLYGNTPSLTIVVGDFDTDIEDEGEQRFLVDKLIFHEQFMVLQNGDYNIALIKVANTSDGRGIRFNDYVQPICLPNYEETCPRKKHLVATGWGAASPTSSNSVRLLKRVSLKCKTNFVCRRKMYPGVEISDRMFCAGNKEGTRDVCEGDVGGPGALKNGSIFILVGIVSHGTLCTLPNDPVIFSTVSEYLFWITTTIENNSNSYERIIPRRN